MSDTQPVEPESPDTNETGLIFEEEETILVIPDQWIIKAPEDPNLPFMLNFYKKNTLLTTFPLTEDNVNTLMPVLETFYSREETPERGPLVDHILSLAKKHKFRTGMLIIIGIITIIGIILTATTGLGRAG